MGFFFLYDLILVTSEKIDNEASFSHFFNAGTFGDAILLILRGKFLSWWLGSNFPNQGDPPVPFSTKPGTFFFPYVHIYQNMNIFPFLVTLFRKLMDSSKFLHKLASNIKLLEHIKNSNRFFLDYVLLV